MQKKSFSRFMTDNIGFLFIVPWLIGFLVFGPMMDMKNAAMLLSGFRSKFVVRLAVTAFLVCFIVVALFMLCGSGGIWI